MVCQASQLGKWPGLYTNSFMSYCIMATFRRVCPRMKQLTVVKKNSKAGISWRLFTHSWATITFIKVDVCTHHTAHTSFSKHLSSICWISFTIPDNGGLQKGGRKEI